MVRKLSKVRKLSLVSKVGQVSKLSRLSHVSKVCNVRKASALSKVSKICASQIPHRYPPGWTGGEIKKGICSVVVQGDRPPLSRVPGTRPANL